MAGACERYVAVCSSARARGVWPTPAEYTVELEEELRGVASVRLRGARVPRLRATDSGRALLHVDSGAGEAAAEARTAPGGALDLAGFLAELEGALNGLGAGVTFAVRVSFAGFVTIYATAPFTVSAGDGQAYRAGSLAGALGLPPAAALAAAPLAGAPLVVGGAVMGFELRAEFPNALDEPLDVYLQIEGFELQRGGGGGYCLEVLRGDGAERDVRDCAVRRFHPPLGRVSRLRVRMRAEDGAPLDFGNRDHRLDLVFGLADPAGHRNGHEPAGCT